MRACLVVLAITACSETYLVKDLPPADPRAFVPARRESDGASVRLRVGAIDRGAELVSPLDPPNAPRPIDGGYRVRARPHGLTMAGMILVGGAIILGITGAGLLLAPRNPNAFIDVQPLLGVTFSALGGASLAVGTIFWGAGALRFPVEAWNP